MTKPFQIDELLARLRALTRRVVSGPGEPAVSFADVTIDLADQERSPAPVSVCT